MSIEEKAKQLDLLVSQIHLEQLVAVADFLEKLPLQLTAIIGGTPRADDIKKEAVSAGKSFRAATNELASLCIALRNTSAYHQV